MAEQVIPLTGVDKLGLIKDIPPVALPPGAFSDCNNVRFRDGAVVKMEGDINIFPYIHFGSEDRLKYVVWWPTPNLAFENSGYYVLIVQQNTTTSIEDNIYIFQTSELGVENDVANNPSIAVDDGSKSLPNFKGTFEPDGLYQHTFFQGGFSLILNNGLQAPKYLLDNEGNTSTANVGQTDDNIATDLPGWDSYAVTIDGTDTTVNSVTAGVVRSFGDFLVAGNLVERDSSNEIIRGLPGVVRTSDIAGPGEIPQNWNPFASGTNTADEFTLTNDGVVQDMVALQGNLYIYSNSSISVMNRTSNATTPISVRNVTDTYGAMTTDCVLEFDGKHLIVGSQDIYLFGGHPGSIQSIADGRVRNYFYDTLNPVSIDNTFILRYQQKDEIWVCYATSDAVPGTVNRALVWNYRLNNWTQRDLTHVLAGVIGPVPGGGVPTGNIGFESDGVPGDEGTNNHVDADYAALIKKFVYDPTDAPVGLSRTDTGAKHEYTVYIQGEFPESTSSTGLPLYYVTYNENSFSTRDDDDRPLRFLAQGQNEALGFLRLDSNNELNISHELPDITYDSSDSATFAEQVTYPILAFLAQQDDISWPRGADALDSLPQWFQDNLPDGETNWNFVVDSAAPVQVHLTDQDNIMAVSFEETRDNGVLLEDYSTTLRMDGSVKTYDADSLTASTDTDMVGILLDEEWTDEPVDDSQGVDGKSIVFQFYLRDSDLHGAATDAIDDYVFFLNNLPEGAVIYRGSPTFADASRDNRDGGDRLIEYDFVTNGTSVYSHSSNIGTIVSLTIDGVEFTRHTEGGTVPPGMYAHGDGTQEIFLPTASPPAAGLTMIVIAEDAGTDLDGGSRTTNTDNLDGERRIYWDFSDGAARTQLVEPILGSTIRQFLLEYDLDTGRVFDFPLQIWLPSDETTPSSMTLQAYDYPDVTTATAPTVAQQAFNVSNVDSVDASDPPVLDFGFIFQEFFKPTDGTQVWGWYVPRLTGLGSEVGNASQLLEVSRPVDNISDKGNSYNLTIDGELFKPIDDWFLDSDYNNGYEAYRVGIASSADTDALAGAPHKLAISQAISHAFQSNADSLLRVPSPAVRIRTRADGTEDDSGSVTTNDYKLTIISEDNAAVRLVADVVGENGRVSVTSGNAVTPLKGLTVAHFFRDNFKYEDEKDNFNIIIVEENQGRHSTTLTEDDIDNTSSINPIRFYLPPLVNVVQTGSFWAAEHFDIDVQLGPIDRDDGSAWIEPAFASSTYSAADVLHSIGYDIVEETTLNDKPLLGYSASSTTLTITAQDFEYVAGDDGDAVPDDGNTPGTLFNTGTDFTYPLRRPIGNVSMTLASTGNGVQTDDEVFSIGQFTTREGAFETLSIPTYTCISISDPNVTEGYPEANLGTRTYFFETTGASTLLEYLEDIVAQINTRISTVEARINDDNESIEIEPITFSSASNFVLAYLINESGSLDAIHDYTDPLKYAQDSLNPIPIGLYQERLLEPVESRWEYLKSASYYTDGGLLAGATLEVGGDGADEADRVFDIQRPWSRNQVNFARDYPIFAAAQIQPNGDVVNKCLASDIGFSRPAFVDTDRVASFDPDEFRFAITGGDEPTSYTSYVERTDLGLTPEFDTESISSIALWTDGSTQPYYRANEVWKNMLTVKVTTTNATGTTVRFEPLAGNDAYIGVDYKTDVRETGRFLNIRVDDSVAPETDNDNADVEYNTLSQWRLAGLQLSVGKAGTR